MKKIVDQLADALPNLSRKLATAGRFAIDNPETMALDSLRGAADKAGVASATMVRLAKAMGYETYDLFRAEFRKGLVQRDFASRASALALRRQEGGKEAFLSDILTAAQENLAGAMATLDAEKLAEMAEIIVKARYTYLVGVGAIHFIARIAGDLGSMALPGLRMAWPGHASIMETLGAVGPEDAILAFSFSPYAVQTVDALEFAKSQGATTLCITDSRSSPLLPHCDHALFAPTVSPHYYPSLVSVVFVLEALLSAAIAHADGAEKIRSLEEIRNKTGLYIT